MGALDAINPNATALNDPGRAPADRVAPYSSWRPLANGRAGVDVVAPGTNLWSTLAIDYTGTNGLVAGVASGTSFATPHVTGEAALLYGAAQYPLFGISDKGTILSTDHKLIKAIIINSADKIPGLDAQGNAQKHLAAGRSGHGQRWSSECHCAAELRGGRRQRECEQRLSRVQRNREYLLGFEYAAGSPAAISITPSGSENSPPRTPPNS